jgi:hypothetical protein
MKISSRVESSEDQLLVTLRTNDNIHNIVIPPKPSGFGSSANGGELLFLALAPHPPPPYRGERSDRNLPNLRRNTVRETLKKIASR